MKNYGWLAVFSCLVVLLLTPPAAPAQATEGDFTQEELAQMLAPVALYQDALLSQVLMAATYPLEVVEADRWLQKNSQLQGDNLDEALREHDWDASVKALCRIPAVLGLMSERLQDTTRLGDAFLAQEGEVMATIQDLRARAIREGNLKSDDKQRVTVGEDGIIVIEPVDPQTVYVPYYNTRYVYGPWWYPAWPPWYWGPGEVVVGSGIYFWPDVYFGFGFGFGYWSHFDWQRRTIIYGHDRRPHFFRPDYRWGDHRGSWRHEPSHRRGVVYRDRPTAERFGQPPARVERAERQSTRTRVRSPVSGSGVSSSKREGLDKSGDRARPAVRKNEPRRQGAEGEVLTGKTERRRGGLADTPRVKNAPKEETTRPIEEKRAKDGEVGQVAPGSREVRSQPGAGAGTGRDSGYERRSGSGRESRPESSRERGDRADEDRGGFGRGGRR